MPPKCKKDRRSFLEAYPELCKEWDYERNEKGPECYSSSSSQRVWWVCSNVSKCGCPHKWKTRIGTRVRGSGCPYCTKCSKTKFCVHGSFAYLYPELAKDWDCEKNKGKPEDYPPSSTEIVWWKCSKAPSFCEHHVWKSSIDTRTNQGTPRECPWCANRRICEHNCLQTSHPELAAEWDYEKNAKTPSEYGPGSKLVVSWVCKNPNVKCSCHKWDAPINKRTSGPKTGCVYCSSHRLCPHNNFAALHPDVAEEWDYEKNKNPPTSYSPQSSKRVWWKCKNDTSHCWMTSMNNRVGDGSGCPKCKSRSHSKIQMKWLDAISKKYEIELRTFFSDDGEYSIRDGRTLYKLDGYCKIRNVKIALEFDGCWYHGCTECFDPEGTNKLIGKTYAELAKKTERKRAFLERNGFVVVTMKECEYIRMKGKEVVCDELEEILDWWPDPE